MKQIVFYSWQSDLPNASNRGFIHDALKNAAAAIAADDAVAIEPVIDRDTQGIPGAPDIASTIFAKITAADIFVCDVSIVSRTETRATPNPNALIELGYAFKALGPERIVLVFNRAFGVITELPFDLRARRVLAYDMPATGTPKGPERKLLERQLDTAIRSALHDHKAQAVAPAIPALEAIESQAPNRIIAIRRNLESIFQRLTALQPTPIGKGGTVDDLLNGLNATQEFLAKFTKIVEVIAMMADPDAALEVLRSFGTVFERYEKPDGFSGYSTNADEDYFKFLGHELFVTFIAALLREDRWNLIEKVLSTPIPMKYVRSDHGPGIVDWRYASEAVPSLLDEGTRRRRISLHADILNERHTTGGLAAVMPMDQFVAADYFLFLLGELKREEDNGFIEWRPWSALYLKRAPIFLRAADHRDVAAHLLQIFGVPDGDEFRRRFSERAGRLADLFNRSGGFWSSPVRDADVQYFGTI
jgi:hypothetical protein